MPDIVGFLTDFVSLGLTPYFIVVVVFMALIRMIWMILGGNH